jgi:hypothetical protein
VNEIVARFRRLSFAVVWKRRSAGAKQLSGKMVSRTRFREALD